MENAILNDLATTNKELSGLINLFKPDQFNKSPFEGSWTPAQVSDHIIKFQSGIPKLMKGRVQETKRDAAEKVQQLKDIFLDFDNKMKSPEFVEPSNLPQDKAIVLKKLGDIFREIKTESENADLTLTCLDFELPGMGPMTKLEWLYFILYHTRRHIHQLRKIFEKVG